MNCGALSSVLYILGINVIAAVRYPDYHGYTPQIVSELMAVGAPTRTLHIWLFIPYNLLLFAFAAGVWASARKKRATRWTAAALVGIWSAQHGGATACSYGPARNRELSPRHATHRDHIRDVGLHRGRDSVRGFRAWEAISDLLVVTIAVVMVFGGLAGVLARPMPDATPGLGLAERVNIYVTMLWMLVFAISTLRVQGESPPVDALRSRDGLQT